MPRVSSVATSDPLGDMLRRARHNHKPQLTQEAVAKALDVVQSTISAWESGRARPSLPDLKRLADFLDLEVSKLVDAAAAAESL
jgi:transcriptional regulator with XRE-family HTH domain